MKLKHTLTLTQRLTRSPSRNNCTSLNKHQVPENLKLPTRQTNYHHTVNRQQQPYQPPNLSTSQPYYLTTTLQPSEGYELANTGKRHSTGLPEAKLPITSSGPTITTPTATPSRVSITPHQRTFRQYKSCALAQPNIQGYSRIPTAPLPTDHSTTATDVPKDNPEAETVSKKAPQPEHQPTRGKDSQSHHLLLRRRANRHNDCKRPSLLLSRKQHHGTNANTPRSRHQHQHQLL